MPKTKPLSKPIKKSTKNRSRKERTQGIGSSSKDFYEDSKVASFSNDPTPKNKPTSIMSEATDQDNKTSPTVAVVSIDSDSMSLKDLVVNMMTRIGQNHAQVMDKTESIANKSVKRMTIINSRLIKLTDTADLISEKIDELLVGSRDIKASKSVSNVYAPGGGGGSEGILDWIISAAGGAGALEYVRRKIKARGGVKPGVKPTKLKPTTKPKKPTIGTKIGKIVKAKVANIKSGIDKKVTSVKEAVKSTINKIKSVKKVKVGNVVKSTTSKVASSAKGLGGKAMGFLGKIFAPAIAVYEGITGYNEAEDIYGKDATFEQKRVSAESKILSTLTLGLLNREDIADCILPGQRLESQKLSAPGKAFLNIGDKPIPEKTSKKAFSSDGNIADMMKVTNESEAIWVDNKRYTFKQLIDAGYLKGNSMFNEKGKMFEKFSYMRNLDNWNVLGGLPEFIRMGSSGRLPQLEGKSKSDGMMATMIAMVSSLFGAGGAGGGGNFDTPDYSGTYSGGGVGFSGGKPGKFDATKYGDLGALSEFHESGGRGAGVVSSGRKDPGGVSYGSYQFATKTGDAQKAATYFAQQDPKKYGTLATYRAGTSKFTTEWKRLAKEDPVGFKKIQHDKIAIGHYQPVVDYVASDIGVDISSLSKSVQQVVWSMSVQHGGAKKLVAKALASAGDDPERQIRSLYKVRTEYVRGPKVRLPHLVKRYRVEEAQAIAMARQEAKDKKEGVDRSNEKTLVQSTVEGQNNATSTGRNEDGSYTVAGQQRNKEEFEEKHMDSVDTEGKSYYTKAQKADIKQRIANKSVKSTTIGNVQKVTPTDYSPEKIMEIPKIASNASGGAVEAFTKMFDKMGAKLDTLSEDFKTGNSNIMLAIQGVNSAIVSSATKGDVGTDYLKLKNMKNDPEFNTFVTGSASKG